MTWRTWCSGSWPSLSFHYPLWASPTTRLWECSGAQQIFLGAGKPIIPVTTAPATFTTMPNVSSPHFRLSLYHIFTLFLPLQALKSASSFRPIIAFYDLGTTPTEALACSIKRNWAPLRLLPIPPHSQSAFSWLSGCRYDNDSKLSVTLFWSEHLDGHASSNDLYLGSSNFAKIYNTIHAFIFI